MVTNSVKQECLYELAWSESFEPGRAASGRRLPLKAGAIAEAAALRRASPAGRLDTALGSAQAEASDLLLEKLALRYELGVLARSNSGRLPLRRVGFHALSLRRWARAGIAHADWPWVGVGVPRPSRIGVRDLALRQQLLAAKRPPVSASGQAAASLAIRTCGRGGS